MLTANKGKSPFYPGQPVPVEFFVGRSTQIERILTRGVGQVELGKPEAIYIQGEYGIGKSSIAGFIQWIAETRHKLHSIYAPLGGAQNLENLAEIVLQATIQSGALDPNKIEKIRNWLAKYIGQQQIGGVNIDFAALKKDAPSLTSAYGMLDFLREALKHLADTGVKGMFLVLDEINGITSNPQFAHFIKGLVDNNAMSKEPLPLLLMLCGVEERRREMIQNHQPVERIFDVIDIEPMNQTEMQEFFGRAFNTVNIKVDSKAMDTMTHYSAGFPKIMHLIGDSAYWFDQDGVISNDDALQAVLFAADDVGKKYVDQQVYKAIRSKDYHSIFKKIAQTGIDMTFHKADIAKHLTEQEKKKFTNFLRKMKTLKVIRNGDVQGEYIFNSRMARVYIWLKSPNKPSS